MADAIQARLERMIPELEELQNLEIFSQVEIKAIIKRRTAFEYALKRSRPDRSDYLNYIQYEDDLNSLKVKRKKKLGISRERLECDVAAVKRVQNILARATSRYPNDVELWNKFIDFCKKTHTYSKLTVVYGDALRMQPLNESLWISAAEHEVNHNGNITGARAIYLRGLRFLGKNKALWFKYCETELLYIAKVKSRSEVITGKESIALPNAEGEDEEADQVENSLKEAVSAANAAKLDSPFFKGAVPRIVYRNAIKNIPDDTEFRFKFLAMFEEFSQKNQLDFSELIQEVCDGLLKEFPHDSTVLHYMANRTVLNDSVQLSAAFQIYESSIKNFPEKGKKDNLVSIWLSYANFCNDHLSKNAEVVGKHLLNVLHKAIEELQLYHEDMILIWVHLLIATNQVQKAVTVLEQSTTKWLPSSSKLWIERASLLMKSSILNSSDDKTEDALKLLLSAIKHKLDDVESVWTKYLDLLIVSGASFEEFSNKFKAAALQSKKTSQFKERIIEKALVAFGHENARELIRMVVKIPGNSEQFFRTCIQLERSTGSPSNDLIRQLFTFASESNKNSESLWTDFINWEREIKDYSNASLVYWKARHSLDNPTHFIQNFSESQLELGAE